MKFKCNKDGITKASEVIKNGGVVVYPTDTIYRIDCNPYDKKAIQRIYKIKSREILKQLPILVYSKEIADKIIEFNNYSKKIAQKIWQAH